MATEGRTAYPLETGGLMLGFWDAADREATAVHVVGAGPKARRERHSFEPDQEWQVHEVARLYANSRGHLEYLGDWHTHPDGVPRPSLRDLGVLWLIAHAKKARARRPLMLIARVTSSGAPVLRAYRYFHGLALRCDLRET